MVPMHGRLGSFTCTGPTSYDRLWSSQRDHNWWDRPCRSYGLYCAGTPPLYSYEYTGISVLPLLLKCRVMQASPDIFHSSPEGWYGCRYSDTIDRIYTHRTFDFRHLEGILEFSSSILPQRLNAITSLRLDGFSKKKSLDWNSGLQYVSNYHRKHIKVTDTDPDYGSGAWEATCQVLAGMKGFK